MGSANGKQLLKSYWQQSRKGLTVSRDNREIRRCFDAYDQNKSGALEYHEAVEYIEDILNVSGLGKKIEAEAVKNQADPIQYRREFVEKIFQEMDSNNNRKIEFDELLKPKEHLWEDFLRFVSVQTLHELRKKRNPANKKDPTKNDKEEDADDGSKPQKKKREKRLPADSDSDHDDMHEDPDDKHRSVIKKPVKVDSPRTGGRSHKALTESGLFRKREAEVKDVVEILAIQAYQAQVLLNYFSWDKEKMLAEYSDNPEKVCEAAGLKYPLAKSDNPSAQSIQEEDVEIECSVCYDDTTEWSSIPACGHQFCNSCWKDNLSVQIKEGHTLDIHCMHSGCTELVSDSLVRKVVPAELYDKYARFVSKAFVENNKTMKWCPAPSCNKAISEPTYEGEFPVGMCACGNTFCWRCGRDAHTPVTCDRMKLWDEKNGEDLLNLKWVRENTKPCPKCKTNIEKNDGCFMMSCSKSGCGHQYCWLCLEPWSTHSNHFECSKFKSKQVQDKPEWREGGPSAGETSSFYKWYERFQAYDQARKLESDNWTSTEQKMRRIVERNESVDPSFLIDSHWQLQKNRRLLQYLCVDVSLETSELKQDLVGEFLMKFEMVTERLAQMTEKNQDIQSINGGAVRELTRLSRKMIASLLQDD